MVILINPPLAMQDASPDQLRLRVIENESEVEIALIVCDPHLSPLRRQRTIHRFALHEVGDDGDRLPERFVQYAVDLGSVLNTARDRRG